MSKGVTFSDMLIGIAQQYKKNNHKYSKEINNQINVLKSRQLLPSKLKRDDILITSWAWNEVVESKTKRFEPAQMLNDIYQSPQKTVHHLDNIITLINSNVFDSQVKKVTNLSQKRFVRMEIDKELLLETEVFLTKEFIGCILGKIRNNSELLSGYRSNREYVDDWFEYVSATEDVGWLRFKGGINNDFLMEAVYDMSKIWQKMVKKMLKTRKKFPLQYLIEVYGLDHNEQTIIMYLLKNELEGQTCEIEKIKQTISQNRCDLLKHQSYFEDDSKLIANSLIELESLHGFKSAFEITLCPDIVLKLMDEKSIKPKNQIKELLQGNDIFSFREPEQSFETLILDREKKDILLHGINQYQNNTTNTLIEWGVYNLKQTGKNQGLLILLYGPPGTGKTYCAHTMANYLNKPLLTTDISRLLSCWVGESEQNVRRLFTTYDKIYKRVENPPVLLLNEADQFLTTRTMSGKSVDRMYNQMQNLFLEAFENFKGVLVCTTNLRDNLDKAFSRRFHLKLEFPLPKFEERKKLWKLHLPETIPGVNDVDNVTLAKRYELSGGQISVVVKNAATEAAGRSIKDRSLQQADLEKYCLLELNSSFGSAQKRYGFAV